MATVKFFWCDISIASFCTIKNNIPENNLRILTFYLRQKIGEISVRKNKKIKLLEHQKFLIFFSNTKTRLSTSKYSEKLRVVITNTCIPATMSCHG